MILKKRTPAFFLCILFFAFSAAAQNANHHFALHDYSIDSISQHQIHLSALTSDGGMVVLTGNEYRGSISLFEYGFSLIKYDASGNKLWNTYLYGDGGSSVAYKRLVELPDHGLLVVANANGFGGGYVVKTDANGNFVFEQFYYSELIDFALDPSDNGFLLSTNSGNTFSSIIKTDSLGAILWSDPRDYFPDPDHYYKVGRLSNGNYLAVGVGYLNPSLVYGVGIIACYSPSGAMLWNKGYSGPAYVTSFNDFDERPDGSIMLSGFSSTTNVDGNWPMAMKIDSLGTVAWAESYGNGLSSLNGGVTFADHMLYTCGNIFNPSTSVNTPLVTKMDSAGHLVWSRLYPFPDWLNNISFGPDKGCSVIGSRLGFSNYSAFCMTDTALSQSCYLHDTSFTVTSITMTPVTLTSSAATAPNTPTSMVRGSSSNENFVKFDACNLTAIAPPKTIATASISVYPNPFSATAVIAVDAAVQLDDASLRVYDVLGHLVKTIPVQSDEVIIDKTGMPAGIYFIELVNKGTLLAREKIMTGE